MRWNHCRVFADSCCSYTHKYTVDFESFSKVLNRPGGFRDPGDPEEYCRGFQVFDKDMTGFIGVGQLRYSELFSHVLLCLFSFCADKIVVQSNNLRRCSF